MGEKELLLPHVRIMGLRPEQTDGVKGGSEILLQSVEPLSGLDSYYGGHTSSSFSKGTQHVISYNR